MTKHPLNFDQARARHLQMKAQLHSILYSAGIEDELVPSTYECGLGKWIYSQGLADFGHVPQLPELEKVHASIHTIARDLIRLFKEGKVEEAQQGFPRIEEITDQLIALLNTVEQTVSESLPKEKPAFVRDERHLDYLERFIRQAPAAICVLDGPELMFELINPSYQQLFPGRHLLGKPLLEALPELKEQPIIDILQNVFHTGETFEGRELLIPLARQPNQAPENMYFNFIYQARFNDIGEVDGVLVFAYDVTDLVVARQKVEQLALQVQQQTRTFDTVLTCIEDFVYTFDIQGRFIYSNKPLLDLLGISLNQIVGKTFHELPYPSDLAQALQEQIAQVIATGKPLTAETKYVNPEGKAGYYEYIFRPVFDQMQQVMLVAGSTRDITMRKQIEEAIQTKNEELIRINVDLDNFIYTASHDLKAPISNIEGLMQLLMRSLPVESLTSERVKHITSLINDSIIRFKKTITDLTDVTKLQKDSNQVSMVDMNEVVQEVLLDLDQLIQTTNARIEVEIANCPTLSFSKKNLRSIMYNLISNALKYRSPERKPLVKIICQQTTENITLSVADNGLGIDLSQKHKLFAIFGRLHNHVEGSGVGLYMVKKILDNSGGRIEVSSQVGQGSTFTMFFKR